MRAAARGTYHKEPDTKPDAKESLELYNAEQKVAVLEPALE